VGSNTPEDFNQFIKSEVNRWASIVKSINLPTE